MVIQKINCQLHLRLIYQKTRYAHMLSNSPIRFSEEDVEKIAERVASLLLEKKENENKNKGKEINN